FSSRCLLLSHVFFFQAEDGIRDFHVTGVQTCALPIFSQAAASVLMELVAAGQLDAESILAMDGTDMMDILGRELVASRPKCATQIGRASCRERVKYTEVCVYLEECVNVRLTVAGKGWQ